MIVDDPLDIPHGLITGVMVDKRDSIPGSVVGLEVITYISRTASITKNEQAELTYNVIVKLEKNGGSRYGGGKEKWNLINIRIKDEADYDKAVADLDTIIEALEDAKIHFENLWDEAETVFEGEDSR